MGFCHYLFFHGEWGMVWSQKKQSFQIQAIEQIMQIIVSLYAIHRVSIGWLHKPFTAYNVIKNMDISSKDM